MGGFTWWSGYPLGDDVRADLSDYLVGVTGSIAGVLEELAWNMKDYQEASASFDHWFRTRLRATRDGVPDLARMNEVEKNRDVRLRTSMTGFYVAACSLMDNLAAVTVGVLGLRTSLQGADAALLRLTETSPDYPRATGEVNRKLRKALMLENESGAALQEGALRAIRRSVEQAGPSDWWQWVDDMRNVRAHQSKRLNARLMPKTGKNELPYAAELSPRQPRYLDTYAMREATDVGGAWLLEDARTTMQGVAESLNAATVGCLLVLKAVWNDRRAAPGLVVQPPEQWADVRQVLRFPGYRPKPLQLDKNLELVTHPKTTVRMRSGRLLD
ncbi:hypothetical protein OG218_00810 [Kineococcus sp. NBC_00420]|uniref:hypothetical protein n=1 Tax=Kineococcus sp. NBC_00420 TaxID=2903564 RepID=UPI002E1F786C